VLAACDHYARGLTRVTVPAADTATQDALRRAASQVKNNLDVVAGILGHGHLAAPCPAGDLLDAAQAAIDTETRPTGERQQLTLAVRYLRRIDLAVIGLSRDLGRHARESET